MNKRWNLAQKGEMTYWKKTDFYKEELEEIKKKFSRFLKEIAFLVKYSNKWKVLDLGCGPTCISRFLPPADKVGIDPLAEKLKLVKKSRSGVKILFGKAEKIPFKNNSFDFIICRNVLDHVENPKKCISEARRVLKNDGFFLLICYVYSRPIALVKRISEKIPFLRNNEHPFTFTPSSLKKLVKQDFILKKEFVVYTGKGPDDYGKINPIKSKLNFLQKLTLFVNFKILRQKWFVKEYCLLLRKRQ